MSPLFSLPDWKTTNCFLRTMDARDKTGAEAGISSRGNRGWTTLAQQIGLRLTLGILNTWYLLSQIRVCLRYFHSRVARIMTHRVVHVRATNQYRYLQTIRVFESKISDAFKSRDRSSTSNSRSSRTEYRVRSIEW